MFALDFVLFFYFLCRIFLFLKESTKRRRGVAQLVERSLWEREVVSSNLATPTRCYNCFSTKMYNERQEVRVNPHIPNKRIFRSQEDENVFKIQYDKYAISHVEPDRRGEFLERKETFLQSEEGQRLQRFKKGVYTNIQDIDICFVDGENLRNSAEGFADFTMGGHGNRYLFISDKDIWIDPANLSSNEREAVIWHEFGERIWMAEGLNYLEAHTLATINEIAMRNDKFRLPVGTYRQSAPGFCGPAALKIVSDYLGERFTEFEFTRITKMDPEVGLTANEMVAGAKAKGFQSFAMEGFTVDKVIKFLKRGYPVIANHWVDITKETDEGHYAVIMGYERHSKNFIISDPSENDGYISENAEEFMRRWYEADDKTIAEGVVIYKGKFPKGLI